MRLHHRVKVKPSRFLGRRLWHWACPACSMVGYATRTLDAAQTDANFHATGCAQLYRWNRETAWPCHNCDHGRIGGTECPCCLGLGYL